MFDKPVDNIGEKTFGAGNGYSTYANKFVYNIKIPGCQDGRMFVGQRKDPFQVPLGKVFDLSPRGIREHLDLNKPIYAKTTAYGHFGRKPITMAWFILVFPCLVINYFGQGAYVIAHAKPIEQPLFEMVPDWATLPMVILATIATIIASQAVITGAYSLTRQAIQMRLLPRFEVRHTSETQSGQIFITPWADDLLSQGIYGIKEEVIQRENSEDQPGKKVFSARKLFKSKFLLQ